MSASLVIPNYNGKDLLAAYLSSVIEAANEYAGQTEVIVVDDASGDGSVEFLRANFPQVRTIAFSQNRSFAHACNTGVRESAGDVVALLNNDMELAAGFLDSLLPHFADASVFAVSAQQKVVSANGTVYNTPAIGQFRHGLIKQLCDLPSERPANLSAASTFYACGGGSAFRRQAYLDLGGFDEVFYPFYWEDVDLSLRAWRRGWKVLFEPRSLLVHHLSSTVSRNFTPFEVKVWSQKNMWLLTWRNTLDADLVALHLLYLLPNLVVELGRRNLACAVGLLQALRQLPAVITARRKEKRERRLRDREMYERFGKALGTML